MIPQTSSAPSPAVGDLPVRGLRPVHMVLIGLAALTLFRLWYCTLMQLVPDEAYYWLWSKHLAASYRDKGPAIAWTIALGRWMFGDTVFGIRFFAVLLGTGTAWELYRLARRLYDENTALWCLAVALVMPLYAVGSILMTIDSLSVFFWAWALNLFWSGLETGRMRHWLLLGLAMGIGFLAKFTNGVQLAGLGLFLLWSTPHRRYLFSRQSLAACVVFGLSLLPILVWNMQTGWIHFRALHERSGVESSFSFHPQELWRYLGGQLGVLSPFLCVGMVIAALGLWYKNGGEPRVKLLLTQFVPLQAIFLFFSLNKAGEANWIAPSLVTGIILLVAFWRELCSRVRRWRFAIWLGLGVAVVMTTTLHLMYFLSLPPRINPLKRGEGWPDVVKHIQQARQQYHPDVLTASHYSYASILQFYLPDRPVTYLPPEPYGGSQFSLWPTYTPRPGMKALYVREGIKAPPAALQSQFRNSKLVDQFWSEHNGQKVYEYQIYLLDNEEPGKGS